MKIQHAYRKFFSLAVFYLGFLQVLFLGHAACNAAASEQASLYVPVQADRKLAEDERQWLAQHGRVKLAYISNLLGNCAQDPATGVLIGSLATYVEKSRHCFSNVELEFEPIAFASINEEIEALRSGKVDCIFPLYASYEEAQKRGLLVTESLYETSVTALVKNKSFAELNENVVATSGKKINKTIYLHTHYPYWRIREYASDQECIEAVRRGEADCAAFNSYGINHIISPHNYGELRTVKLSGTMDLAIAVRQEDKLLLSILNDSITLVSKKTLEDSLENFASPDAEQVAQQNISIFAFLRDKLLACFSLGVVLFGGLAVAVLQLYKR